MFNRIEISIIRRYNSTYLLQLCFSVIRVSDDPQTDDTKVVQSAIIPQWSNKRKLVILSISRTNGMWLLMVWLVEPFFAICGYLLLFYFRKCWEKLQIHYFFQTCFNMHDRLCHLIILKLKCFWKVSALGNYHKISFQWLTAFNFRLKHHQGRKIATNF